MNKHHRRFSSAKKQQGASLFIALIILLVVTLLAVSSTREVTLESRITGNFIEQQNLANSAESGLRDGESRLTAPLTPLDPTTDCAAVGPTAQPPCLLNLSPTYTLLFATAGKFRPYYPKNGTAANPNTAINWYALEVSDGGENGESENPENPLSPTGISRYEVNSQATNTLSNNTAYLRSTTAKFFDNGN